MNVSALRLLLVCVLVALGIVADSAGPSACAPLGTATTMSPGDDLPDDTVASDFDLDDDDDDDDDRDDGAMTAAIRALVAPSHRQSLAATAATAPTGAPLASLFRPPQRARVL